MKKRVLSMLLVMLLVFSLLPAAALAANPVNPAQADLGEDLHMTKKLELTEDGSYKLTLESWATGKTTQIGGDPIPSDIVLVIDQSGSMGYDMLNRAVTAEELYRIADSDGRTPYVSSAWLDHNIYITKNSNGTYTIYFDRLILGRVYIAQNVTGDTLINPQNREFKISRLEATKIALRDFVDSIAAKNGDHRIAIVGFASENSNTEIFNGSNSNSYNTVMSSSTNYAEYSLKNASTQKSVLNSSINALSADGGTLADRGMELAEKILSQRTDAEGRGAAVILFTDGNPGLYGDDNGVANNAIAISNRIENNLSGKVFTLGVFDSADGDSALINENEIYKVKDYMEGVSSMYPSLTNMSQLYATPAPEADTSAPYYQKITGNSGDDVSLSEMFDNISEVIDITGTTVTLDGDSVLRDVIKSADFNVAPGAAVSAKAVKMADGSKDDAATSKLQYSKTVPSDGVIDVKGFDYSDLYHTDGHPGDKLIVTITGLIPKHSGALASNTNAGVYENSTDTNPVISIDTPTLAVAKQANVIDFNAKMILDANVTRMNVTRAVNGVFDSTDGVLSYQLKPNEKLGDLSGNLVMNGVDTAMTFNGTEWKEHQAIPANNIYFDDALLKTEAPVTDGAGYNVRVTTDAAKTVTDVADGSELLYTFTGTGIDVYCTTNAAGGYVQAGLMTGEGKHAENLVYFEREDGHYFIDENGKYVRIDKDHPAPDGATLYDSSLIAVRNYSVTPEKADRYNVPTVSYTGLPYGTYTIRIVTVENANYKLDGIRIYNAMDDPDKDSVYAGTHEANARFYNLRDALLNDGQDVTVKKQDESSVMKTYLGKTDSELLPGVLFIDDQSSVKLEKTVVDAQGNFVLDEKTGKPKTELVYKDAYSAYVANGPKNEIYLEAGQGIAFKIDASAQGDHYWIGLSVPDQGSTSAVVKVNNKAVEPTITSAVDMYYPITPREDGTVVIVNNGDAMVSVTNLKVTSDLPADKAASPFALLSADALDLAADTTAVEAQDNAVDQNLKDVFQQLISNFVRILFNNIARMFGK